MDRETGVHRGFGFISYSNPNVVEGILSSGPHVMLNQTVRFCSIPNLGHVNEYCNSFQLEVRKSTPRARRDGREGPPVAIGPDYGHHNGHGGAHPRYGGSQGQGTNYARSPQPQMGGFDPQAMAALFKNFGGGTNWQGYNPMLMMQAIQGGGQGMMGYSPMGMTGNPAMGHVLPPKSAPPVNAPVRSLLQTLVGSLR